jgi:hypothetical protein
VVVLVTVCLTLLLLLLVVVLLAIFCKHTSTLNTRTSLSALTVA